VSPQFTINFRRESYRLQLARTRRRMLSVGIWLAYFGVLAIALGLYDLNCASLARRTQLLEAQNRRLGAAGHLASWKPVPAELAQAERALANPRRWQLRLARLAALLPPNVVLTSVATDPDNLSSGPDQEKLVVSGMLRPGSGQDPMEGVSTLVSALRADSLFASQYRSIQMVGTSVGAAGAPAEFRIECRR
jgi:hypothetical protein